MNVDIRVATDLFEHPKLRRLSRLLDVHMRTASGVLLQLWCWTAIFRPGTAVVDDDDLQRMYGAEDHQTIKVALIEAGFLDQDGEGRYGVHNWGKRNTYASHAKDRVEFARLGADARWSKHRAVTTTGTDASTTIAGIQASIQASMPASSLHQKQHDAPSDSLPSRTSRREVVREGEEGPREGGVGPRSGTPRARPPAARAPRAANGEGGEVVEREPEREPNRLLTPAEKAARARIRRLAQGEP